MKNPYFLSRWWIRILIITLSNFIILGCASTGSGPQPVLYSDQILGIYSNGLESIKEGEACSYSILGLVAFGDGSTQKAQSNAVVSKINSIDHRSLNIFVFFAKLCTVVKGE